MAGKTIRGAGVDGESSRRTEPDGTPTYEDEDDSRGVHSGPTVVDDKKVAEVLKKLRSLDRPPGPLTGVTQAVVDTNSSERTRVDSGVIRPDSAVARRIDSGPTTKVDVGQASLQDLMYPVQRSTAIGRSLSAENDAQPLTMDPLARGTMLGHSIHGADDNAPQEASIELSSGAVQFVEGTAPSQPFPVAVRPVVALPAPTAQAKRFHTPYDTDPRTDPVVRPRSKVAPVIALLGGFAVVAGGWYAWTQMRGKPADGSPAPAASTAAAPAAAPSIVPIPSAAEPAAPPAAAPVPPPPAPAPATPPAAAAPADEARPPRAAAAAEAPATKRHRQPTAERRRAARIVAPSEPTEPPAASKPVRSRRHNAIPADPDATLPPSL